MAPERIGDYVALDLRFSVTADEPLASWLRAALAPLATEAPADGPQVRVLRDTPRSWEVRVDDEQVCRRAHPHQVLHRLTVDLNQRIATSTHRHLVLHAGVVESAHGTVLLAAPSGSGKSTMVATAAREGWGYGGDEHAALRFEDGLVDPVPKPLGLKYGSATRFADLGDPGPAMAGFLRDQLFLVPSSLPGGVIQGPRAVRLVALPEHDPDSPGVVVEPLTPAAGLMALRENAFNFAQHPRDAFRALSALVRAAPILRVRYDDAASALTVLFDYGT